MSKWKSYSKGFVVGLVVASCFGLKAEIMGDEFTGHIVRMMRIMYAGQPSFRYCQAIGWPTDNRECMDEAAGIGLSLITYAHDHNKEIK